MKRWIEKVARGQRGLSEIFWELKLQNAKGLEEI
jgi:hypothetical protein